MPEDFLSCIMFIAFSAWKCREKSQLKYKIKYKIRFKKKSDGWYFLIWGSKAGNWVVKFYLVLNCILYLEYMVIYIYI